MIRKVSFLFVGLSLVVLSQVAGSVNAIAQQPARAVIFTASITTAQETPVPTPSNAVGAGVFVLNAARTELAYAVSFTGLSGAASAAHLHGPANVGTAAGVKRSICAAAECAPGTLLSGVWKSSDMQQLTPELVTALLQGQMYFNVHTTANGGGEARGQLVPISLP